MTEAEQIVRALAKQCDGYWVWNERVLREAGLVEVLEQSIRAENTLDVERLKPGMELWRALTKLRERSLGRKLGEDDEPADEKAKA